MTDVFFDHGLDTGDDDGSSWANAYRSVFDINSELSPGDHAHVKEHAGIDCDTTGIYTSTYCEIHGGYDSSLTGTETGQAYQTGFTVLDGTSLQGGSVAENHGFYLSDSGNYAITGFICKNFENSSTGTMGSGCGILVNNSGIDILIENVKLLNNYSSASAAAALYVSGTCTLKNVLAAGNVANANNGAMTLSGEAHLIGCTIADNTSETSTIGGIRLFSADSTVDNCIFYNNDDYDIRGNSLTITYCDYESLYSGTTAGTGCVSVDPQFLGTGDDPYQLSSSTPTSVTQGASTGITGYVDYDILGEDRDDSTPSMGCYEYISASNIDILGSGAIIITGANISGLRSQIDVLASGAVSASGSSVDGYLAKVDTLSSGEVSVTGTNIDGSLSGVDTLASGAVSVTGANIDGLRALLDTPGIGEVAVSGANIDGSLGAVDILSGGSVTVSGANVSGLLAQLDQLGVGAVNVTGANVDGTIALLDALGAGSVTVTGSSIDGFHVYEAALSGGTVTVSGASISGLLAQIDILGSGAVTISGSNINGAADTDIVLPIYGVLATEPYITAVMSLATLAGSMDTATSTNNSMTLSAYVTGTMEIE